MISNSGTSTLGLYDLKRQIDAFGGVDYFRPTLAGGYIPNARVMLANGEIVQNRTGGNLTNDPNTDMAGWVKINPQYLNVLDEGILPNSSADQSAKIIAADLKASAMGKKLYFPAGLYLASGLNPTAAWVGAGAELTRIKHANPTSAFTGFISSTKLKPYSIMKGITFDGSVSADPVAWNSSNYNSFTGAIAYSLAYSSFICFQECNFENSFWSNVRIEKCENIFLINCNTKKARGNFGDGVYTYNSKGIYEINCTAEDFTRIGFVKEQNSHNFVQINCHAKNGHDGSILYGGGEYNAGFWNENSSNSELAYCTANDIRHYGFITSTGTVITSNGNDYWHTLTNCTSKNCDSGFVGQSFAGAPVTTKYQNCKSFNSTFPFNIACNNALDIYILDGCTSDMNWQTQPAGTIKGLLISGTARGKVKIRNTMFSRKNAVASDLTDKTKYIADVIHYGAVQQDVEIDRCYASDGSAVVIKQINASGKIGLDIHRTKVDLRKIASMNSDLKLVECEIVYADFVNSAESHLLNCKITGLFTASISDKINFNGGYYTANSDAEYIFISSALNTKKVLVNINGMHVKKNIATGDYAIRLQFEGFNKPLSILNSVILENVGNNATTDKVFVWAVRSKDASQTTVGSTNILYQNVIKDSSVTHIQKTNTTLVDNTTINGITSVIF